MSTRALIATVCQAGRFFPTPEANRQHVLDLLKLALRRNPDLVCLPETFTTPSVPRQTIAEIAEDLPGPTSEAVSQLARQHRCYVVCPIVARRQGKCWNSVAAIDRLKAEFGFVTVAEYMGLHENAYPWLRRGELTPPQRAAHGDRPMYSKMGQI
jgi:predicted amidohydrolase